MDSPNDLLRRLPAVHVLLEHPRTAEMLADGPREPLVQALRSALDEARAAVLAGGALPSNDELIDAAWSHLAAAERAGLCRVVNATGIVLHTGLGRAVLPQAAIDALVAEAGGYCLLANDPETNRRGRRERFCERVLTELTGAPSATIVNNNAAAVLLVLNTLAGHGGEVIISRGQQVEIGGSYRMPDVMEAAGCRMVEVGCTNRTHLRDYARAITENTAAIIRVHTSNYRIQGFTKEVPIDELAALGREHGIPVVDDLGAGALVDLRAEFDEPLVSHSIDVGADLVTCSSDKLIGGPQGGIILGGKEIVRRVELNQMSRALRVGKLDLIALEATLKLFRDPATLLRDHPTSRMLSESAATVGARADVLLAELRAGCPGIDAVVEDGESFAGSGALPIRAIPSRVVVVTPPTGTSAGELARRLRLHDVPVYVRVKSEQLHVDPRTIQPGENAVLVAAMASAIGVD